MLVLVMTLLGVLFVLGVAFLATMNFEAEMIATQKLRDRSTTGVNAAAADVGSMLRDSMMASSVMPFGDTTAALSSTAYAEMPGVQNTFSPIEPVRLDGGDTIVPSTDDLIVFNGYFDPLAQRQQPFTGPTLPPAFAIDTCAGFQGTWCGFPDREVRFVQVTVPPNPPVIIQLTRCVDGPNKGMLCDPAVGDADCQTNPTDPYTCEGVRVADADGDGVVDSILVSAADLGLSGMPLDELAARVNADSNPTGKVRIALRVIPHGGLVNLNDSHPNLIENVLGLPAGTLDPTKAPDPNLGNFVHRPTLFGTLYSPLLEEPLLRRRNLLPAAAVPPSTLQGNALLTPASAPTGAADMAWFLYPPAWPGGAAAGKYETVFNHRYAPLSPVLGIDYVPPIADPNLNLSLWAIRTEPFSAMSVNTTTIPTFEPEFDRRHLVTTVSYDDLLARSAMITTPVGSKDLRAAMVVANQSIWDPNFCPALLPFEYAEYPPHLPEETDVRLVTNPGYDYCDCPTSAFCRVDPRKGRLQLSLPWVDDALADAQAITDPQLREEAINRVYHTIHDAFFMLVRNAAARTKVEGMPCQFDDDCPVRDTVCSQYTRVCMHASKIGTQVETTFAGCTNAITDCAIEGSICNIPLGKTVGVCELAAPAWRDRECVNDPDCNPGGVVPGEQFCRRFPGATVGLCADNWTKLPRSEALISRTAASLTANMIDFVDSDAIPTRVPLRDFEFVPKCENGDDHRMLCDPSNPTHCPNARCWNLAGRDIDLVANVSGNQATLGVQPQYVYGLERQPYMSEVVTLADAAAPNQLVGWAVELFYPYPLSIPASGPLPNEGYYIIEDGTPPKEIPLTDVIQGTGGVPPTPFTTYYHIQPPGDPNELLGTPRVGAPIQLPAATPLSFRNGTRLYLVRRVVYLGDPNPTDIVVDQVVVNGDNLDLIGKEGADLGGVVPPFRFAIGRVVQNQGTMWTGTVPEMAEAQQNVATLGTWNDYAVIPAIHPVEIQFADTDLFGPDVGNQFATPAFPTTGSLALLIRHANRGWIERDIAASGLNVVPGLVKYENLAFTTSLAGETTATARFENPPLGNVYPPYAVPVETYTQIDNGRMPLFDVGVDAGNVNGDLAAHHLPPQMFKAWYPPPTNPDPSLFTSRPLPGDLNTLPWGQLVYDYFTALPLSNPGPYLVPDVNPYDGYPDYPVALPDALPRVDQDGARVHGRINLNAAPWTVLAGLPFVPMNRIPDDSIRQHVAGTLGITGFTDAVPIGRELAQAIVAYREAATLTSPNLPGAGDYNNDLPPVGPAFPRGWSSTDPAVRRGTGFMSVGELANIRHPGAALATPPASWPYRFDYQVIGRGPTNNDENFLDAAAVLVALSDWVTMRSQVFTVYGVIRGEPDPLLIQAGATPNALVQDVDSRAIRFQETLDRLPTLLGEPAPRRIGDRKVTKVTDVFND